MSQAKVDRYKAEKKNRSKVMKKKKIRNIVLLMLAVLFISMGIGYPLGQYLYKVSYEKRMENATISAMSYDYWFNINWEAKYGDSFTFLADTLTTEDTEDVEDTEDSTDTEDTSTEDIVE